MNSTASLVPPRSPDSGSAAPVATGTERPFSATISRATGSACASGALPNTVVMPMTSIPGALSAATMA